MADFTPCLLPTAPYSFYPPRAISCGVMTKAKLNITQKKQNLLSTVFSFTYCTYIPLYYSYNTTYSVHDINMDDAMLVKLMRARIVFWRQFFVELDTFFEALYTFLDARPK